MTLPRFVVIKSNATNKYLWSEGVPSVRYIEGVIGSDVEEIVSPYAKFAVEPSENYPGFVHIRCCYSNKYWVKGSDLNNKDLILAIAREKGGDKNQRSCTLFELVTVDSTSQRYCLRDANSGHFARVVISTGALCTEADNVAKYDDASFTFTDWESLVFLPKRVAFKGDNDIYLAIYREAADSYPYVTFLPGDLGDTKVWNTVVTRRDGCISILSNDTKKFWDPVWSWVIANSDESDKNGVDNTWFRPVMIDIDNKKVIALRHVKKDLLCSKDPYKDWPYGLSANAKSITKKTFLTVEEPVLKRTISDVSFNLLNPRIYEKVRIKATTAQASNATNESQTMSVDLWYADTTSSTWDRVIFNTGVDTHIEHAPVPLISEDKVVTPNKFSGKFVWGETLSSSSGLKKVYKVALRPRTKVTVSLFATKGTYDVPFSYTQRDILTNGSIEIDQKNDGLYTGTNLFDFNFETKEEPF